MAAYLQDYFKDVVASTGGKEVECISLRISSCRRDELYDDRNELRRYDVNGKNLRRRKPSRN